jgi:shikimate dehydrogenase
VTRRAAVLGHPIAHSLSPVLHRAAYGAMGLDWTYEAVDIDSDGLGPFLADLGADWVGLSLTMPLKQAVLPFLARSSATVAQAGGANTVLVTPAGLEGHNTDVDGIVAALRAAPGYTAPRTVTILGAGATAASALVAVARLGAQAVLVCARRREAAMALTARGRELEVPVAAGEWGELGEALAADLVICTLPGDAAATLSPQLPSGPGLLLDVTYHPWPTTLAAEWVGAGGTVVPGHQMLLWQAVGQVELMTGRSAPVAAMKAALESALDRS